MELPLWLCAPFAGLLLCIAVFPLVKEEWWEHNRHLAVIFWSLLFCIPFAVLHGVPEALEVVLECIINDYLTFIVLLFGLFCVAGNITVEGTLVGNPRVNVLLLGVGTILSSILGTTGASMLLVRPIIKMNAWRKNKTQVMVFFIFLISNMGGCLTPIGDPPLLMGFSRGVPFFWSLSLFPLLAINMAILLTVFYFLDRRAYQKDIAIGRVPKFDPNAPLLRIKGAHNLFFILLIIVAVVLSGILPDTAALQTAEGEVRSIHIFREVELSLTTILECFLILLSAFLSFKTTDAKIRQENHFTWGAIEEVAVLFIGIFITMQPALMILKTAGENLGITAPSQLFWVTGILSSFLDNTPTYLVFLTTIAGMRLAGGGIVTAIGTIPVKMLMAISCGAVFMGANTYIGNAPNFMVKAISDENGVRMPSFFAYIGWSIKYLAPLFLIDMLIFFL